MRQRVLVLNVEGRDDRPDVADVLVSARRIYLIVDVVAETDRRLRVLCDVYHGNQGVPVGAGPATDGQVWTLTNAGS